MAVTDHVCSELTGFNDIDVWLQKGYVREENNISRLRLLLINFCIDKLYSGSDICPTQAKLLKSRL